MEIFDDKQMVPFSCEQMFDLVSAVEQYPEFLPGWRHTRILESNGNISRVEQELSWKGVRMRFISRVTYTRPSRIEITSAEAPFRQLNIRWIFEPPDPAPDPIGDTMCCVIRLQIGFDLRSTVLRHIVQPIIRDRLRGIVSAFEERAHLVYPGTHELSECTSHPKVAGIR